MKPARLVWSLTVVNLALAVLQGVRMGDAFAKEDLPLLRGRGLEIVDDAGRVRVQLKLEPANPTYKWPDGSRIGYPETVLFRLITADGQPRVKLSTSEEGSGLLLSGTGEWTHAILTAHGTTSLRLRNDEKTEKLIGP